MATCAHLPFIRPCAARSIIQGSLACSPRLRRPGRMLLHSCMCRTEATRIVAHMCHGALRPFHTLALVEERADSLSLLGARLQAEGVTLIALASRFWLRVLDLRRDLDLGRDERPATFMATDALWMPVHRNIHLPLVSWSAWVMLRS